MILPAYPLYQTLTFFILQCTWPWKEGAGWTRAGKDSRGGKQCWWIKTKLEGKRVFFCDIPLRRQTDSPAPLRKNKISWWARYVEHLLGVSSLAESITLNSPTRKQWETLYINRRALSYPTADVEYSSSRSGSRLYESFKTPTLLTSPSLPTCPPGTPSPTMSRRQHQLSLYLTSHITANSYINVLLRQQRSDAYLFLAQ